MKIGKKEIEDISKNFSEKEWCILLDHSGKFSLYTGYCVILAIRGAVVILPELDISYVRRARWLRLVTKKKTFNFEIKANLLRCGGVLLRLVRQI
jgi:hypothetical protein